MRLNLRRVVVVLVGLFAVSGGGIVEAKTKIAECNCSIKTPGQWYVLEYYQTPQGVEYLVSSSPFEHPGEDSIPGVQFVRQKFGAGVSGTAEEFLAAVAEQLKVGTASPPAASTLGGLPGSRMDVVYKGKDGKPYYQRYYATVRDNAAYVLIITWADAEDLAKLEKSVASVKF